MTFLAKSLPKLHEPAPTNDILQPLFTYLLLYLFATIIIARSKHFINTKSFSGFLTNNLNHKQCRHLRFWQFSFLN